MGKKKINEAFLSEYMRLDSVCCEKFGVSMSGVTEYINRLNNARFSPGRDDVLPRLVKYRSLRNRFAHEPNAIRKTDELTKDDVKWMRSFEKIIQKKKDPISLYLRKARQYVRRRRLRRFFIVFGLVDIAILAVVIAYLFKG